MNRTSLVILATAVAAGAGIAAWRWLGDSGSVDVRVPASLTEEARAGKAIFDRNCRVCHGTNAAGTKSGPPLVHRIYEPGHHSDRSFQLAVSNGVRAHHWPYGNMPAISGVSSDEVGRIVQYVRELQRANGIY